MGTVIRLVGRKTLDWRLVGSLCVALAIVLPVLATAEVEPSQNEEICPFCRAQQQAEAYLCTNCGRLFRVESLDPGQRFWGDAFYIFDLPTNTARPELVAEVSEAGLVRETATFDLGDRYDYGKSTKGIEISARVFGAQTKEVDYKATFVDTYDELGRLAGRVVSGQLNAKPKRYLHRRITYEYDGGRIDSAKAKSWIYSKANDWEKRPGQWIRHRMTDIRFDYEGDVLVRVRTEHRKGIRDLRGNADYAPPKSFVEAVKVRDGVVTGFGRPEAQP